MPFNTLSVGAAVTPAVIETYFSHYLNRAPLREKPTAHISYHEGLRLIRQFLDYASRHTVEDIQAFTAQWVPAPTWVRIQQVDIAPQFLDRAADVLQQHFGLRELAKLGGATWWTWRRPESPLCAEWIEMKQDHAERKRAGTECQRCILYIHGGAYYFGSVDEHRYQMQRHARKLKARVLAPRYRLAPQFPFPCGLYDCLAAYLYLLEHFKPSQILFGGDSAGGGMVLSLLITLRDQKLPLPAGTILLSPWVDLTHSFPSVAGEDSGDYIPSHGFMHRPSMAWPPKAQDEQKPGSGDHESRSDAVELPATESKGVSTPNGNDKGAEDQQKGNQTRAPTTGKNLRIFLDGEDVELKEQIQMYAPNEMLAHPMVSPVMQPSLGGLPPMLVQVGGAELLRDEQIYLAHKAANPKTYPPSDAVMKEYDPDRNAIDGYPPTDVQLQVWDDLCHVPHTLSFTRPAKYMYRSVAQFGAWALSHAQNRSIEIQDDDAVSIISSRSSDEDDAKSTMDESKGDDAENMTARDLKVLAQGAVGKAGDPLPKFKNHMIRQRVSRHGIVFALPPASSLPALKIDPSSIGQIKPGPVRKWLASKRACDRRFEKHTKRVAEKREKEMGTGYDAVPGETPPPSALVNRRRKGIVPEEKKKGKSWGLAMWSGWGSSHDQSTLEREEKASAEPRRSVSQAPPRSTGSMANDSASKRSRRRSSASKLSMGRTQRERPRTPYRNVSDNGQVENSPSDKLPRTPYRNVSDTGQVGNTPSDQNRPATPAFSFSAVSAQSESEQVPDDRADRTTANPSSPLSQTQENSQDQAHDAPFAVSTDPTHLSPENRHPHIASQAHPLRPRKSASTASFAGQRPDTFIPHTSELATDIPAHQTLQQQQYPQQQYAQPQLHPAVSAASLRSATSNNKLNDAVSPVDAPTPRQSPFHQPFRAATDGAEAGDAEGAGKEGEDAVFDPRTSMLGSLGADGMPNAHYEFGEEKK